MTRRIIAAVLAVALALCGPAWAANPPAPTPPGTAQTVQDPTVAAAVAGRNNFLASASTSFAANATLNDGNFVLLGSSPSPYTYVVASFYSSQAGTYFVQVADGNGVYTMQTGSLAAAAVVTVRLPVAIPGGTTPKYRAYILNGGTPSNLAWASIALMAN